MSKHIDSLVPEFRIKVNELVRICSQEGVEMLVYCGLRTCEEQAKLYRQSRKRKDIDQKAQSFRDRGFDFLADTLYDVGPQPGTLGKHVTKAGPGESWHQYALAADSVPLIGGKAMWSNDDPGWDIYGAVARHLDITWAGDWPSFREMPHIQLYKTSSPLTQFREPDTIKTMLVEAKSL